MTFVFHEGMDWNLSGSNFLENIMFNQNPLWTLKSVPAAKWWKS